MEAITGCGADDQSAAVKRDKALGGRHGLETHLFQGHTLRDVVANDSVIGGGCHPREIPLAIPSNCPGAAVGGNHLMETYDLIGGVYEQPVAGGISGKDYSIFTERNLAHAETYAQGASLASLIHMQILNRRVETVHAHDPVFTIKRLGKDVIGGACHLERVLLCTVFGVHPHAFDGVRAGDDVVPRQWGSHRDVVADGNVFDGFARRCADKLHLVVIRVDDGEKTGIRGNITARRIDVDCVSVLIAESCEVTDLQCVCKTHAQNAPCSVNICDSGRRNDFPIRVRCGRRFSRFGVTHVQHVFGFVLDCGGAPSKKQTCSGKGYKTESFHALKPINLTWSRRAVPAMAMRGCRVSTVMDLSAPVVVAPEAMSWTQVVVLSIVQGLTEFLPVSSSGHLRIVSELFWGQDAGASFTAVIQLGTELAVLVFFAKEIWQILTGWFAGVLNPEKRGFDYRMGWMVIVGTIPVAVAGLLLKDLIRENFRNLWITAAVLILFSFVFIFAERVGKKTRGYDELTMKDAIAMGLWQCLALIPGVSRSGGTISGGLFRGLDREVATRFSFLLAIPAVLASGLFSLPDAFAPQAGQAASGSQLLVGSIIAFALGYASIAWLLKFVSHHSFAWFAAYRIPLGIIVMILLATGVMDASGGAVL